MSRDELLKTWVEEAREVLKSQEESEDGLCVWKSAGKREVLLIFGCIRLKKSIFRLPKLRGENRHLIFGRDEPATFQYI